MDFAVGGRQKAIALFWGVGRVCAEADLWIYTDSLYQIM